MGLFSKLRGKFGKKSCDTCNTCDSCGTTGTVVVPPAKTGEPIAPPKDLPKKMPSTTPTTPPVPTKIGAYQQIPSNNAPIIVPASNDF